MRRMRLPACGAGRAARGVRRGAAAMAAVAAAAAALVRGGGRRGASAIEVLLSPLRAALGLPGKGRAPGHLCWRSGAASGPQAWEPGGAGGAGRPAGRKGEAARLRRVRMPRPLALGRSVRSRQSAGRAAGGDTPSPRQRRVAIGRSQGAFLRLGVLNSAPLRGTGFLTGFSFPVEAAGGCWVPGHREGR